jgi:uncharacterized protein (DUF58 family)
MAEHQEIIKKIRKVRIRTQRLVDTLFAGEYASAFQGHGIEFSEVRPYSEGDDIRLIDWNVTARMNAPYIKRYIEERELKIYILVDISPSHDFGSIGEMKREIMTQFVATISWLGISKNDKVGVTLFSDHVEKSFPPRKGKKQLARIIESVLYFKPTGKATAIIPALNYIGRVAKRRGVVFIVSDFLTNEDLARPLRILAFKHDVVLARISDRWERELPNVGMVEVEDPETGEVLLVDTSDPIVRSEYKKLREKENAVLSKARHQSGIDLIELSTGESFLKPLMAYLRKRRERRGRRAG